MIEQWRSHLAEVQQRVELATECKFGKMKVLPSYRMLNGYFSCALNCSSSKRRMQIIADLIEALTISTAIAAVIPEIDPHTIYIYKTSAIHSHGAYSFILAHEFGHLAMARNLHHFGVLMAELDGIGEHYANYIARNVTPELSCDEIEKRFPAAYMDLKSCDELLKREKIKTPAEFLTYIHNRYQIHPLLLSCTEAH